MCMATKTISIMDDVYELLLGRKGAHESFSDVIRNAVKRRDILEFAGAWADLPEKRLRRIKLKIKELRRRATKELAP